MPWTTPTNRSTGDLITAAIWNQDVVDNSKFLHDRPTQLLIPPDTYNFTLGDWQAREFTGNGTASFRFRAPADFAALSALKALVIPNGTGTITGLSLNSDYGAEGEAYNQHSGAASGVSLGVTSGILKVWDLSGLGLLSSLAAGDYVGLKITTSFGTFSAGMPFLIVEYTRS